MVTKSFLSFLFTIVVTVAMFAQQSAAPKPQVIKLDNPSFEDFPSQGTGRTPTGWFDCGFAGESSPDIQPNGGFNVTKPAHHGSTYLGMVTRDNNTWESIGQRLKSPLLKGITYTFSIYACKSEYYLSKSRLTDRDVNYTQPVILRVWAGMGYCANEEMLAETEVIANTNWLKFNFKFTPKSNQSYITIQAFYKVPSLLPYNGNLLIDNASDIVPEIKNEPKPPVVAAVTPKPKPQTSKPETKPKTTDTTPSVASVEKPKTAPKPKEEAPKAEELPTISPEKLKEGQIIKIEKLQFKSAKAIIDSSSYAALDEIFYFLNNNSNLIVELGGHTNLVMSDDAASERFSKSRAQAVADYLVNKGIDRKRLVIRGYGKSKPIENATTQAANKVNQRVEIKILSTNG